MDSSSRDEQHELGDLSIVELMELSVYGASKHEQKVTQAPASVTVVSADEIRKYGYRTLADVLGSVAGVYVTNNRNYSFLGFRGFSQPGDFNTGVLLLVDGHRVNDATYNLMYVANEALIDVDMIERVEIIRGPSSSIYGNSAFFGVINVITRRGGNIAGGEASAAAGSFDTYGTRIASGRKLGNGVEYAVSGSYYGSQGQRRLYFPEFDSPQNNNGIAVDADDESAYRGNGSVSWQDFVLAGAYSHRDKTVPTATGGTAFNAGPTQTTDDRSYLDLKYEHRFAGELTLMSRISYDRYPYRATFAYANSSPPPGLVLNHDGALGEWARTELQLTQRILGRHTVIVGAEYQYNLRQHQENYDQDPYASYLDINHHSYNYALYAQAEVAPWRKVLINAGLRYDHHYSFGQTVNPRVAVIFSPVETATFKAIYGRAFRAPNEYELNYQSSNFQNSPDLQAETISTYELVYEQRLPANLRFTASGYRNDIDQLISLQTDPATGQTQFRNLQGVQANGIEVQLDGRYASGFTTRMSYAYQIARDADSAAELSNSPRHLAKVNLSVPLHGDLLFGSAEAQYRGASFTPGRERVGGFLLINTTLFSERLMKRVVLSGSIYDVLDRRYSTPAGGSDPEESLQQDGRSFRLKATFRF